MLKKFVVATLACLTIFLSRRAMTESETHRAPAAVEVVDAQIRTASAF